MRQASLKVPVREPIRMVEPIVQPESSRSVVNKAPAPAKAAAEKPEKASASKSVKPAAAKSAKAPDAKPVGTNTKAGDKKVASAAKPVTRPVRTAKVDPLAPLPASANSKKTTGNSGTAR
jgi:hypothetical protein